MLLAGCPAFQIRFIRSAICRQSNALHLNLVYPKWFSHFCQAPVCAL